MKILFCGFQRRVLRSYKYITDATSYDLVENPKDFYESAVAFGHFQKLLSNYPAETLNETIKGFHDTESRLIAFKEAVEKIALAVQQKYKRRFGLSLSVKKYQVFLENYWQR